MDSRLTFNTDPESYDKFRARYTKELFDDVIRFSHLSKDKNALEIGIGTGQATPPFLQTGCTVTAIELGDNLARFCRDKFTAYKNFNVINQDFESVALSENAYDLIYSASAFHWIPPETGLPKVYALLKSGGVFSWFANQPAPSEEHAHIHEAIQAVYNRHAEFFGGKSPAVDLQQRLQQAKEKCRSRNSTLKQYGFTDVVDKIYHSARTFSAEDYAAQISTHHDHKAMPEEIRLPFLQEIADVINRHGGIFTLADIIILSMGRKL